MWLREKHLAARESDNLARHGASRNTLGPGQRWQWAPLFKTLDYLHTLRPERKERVNLFVPSSHLPPAPLARQHWALSVRPLFPISSSFTHFYRQWERSHKHQSPSNEPFVYRGNKKYARVTWILPVLSVNCNYLPPQTYFGIIWFQKYSTGENYLIQVLGASPPGSLSRQHWKKVKGSSSWYRELRGRWGRLWAL